jgi:hypothetical protein
MAWTWTGTPAGQAAPNALAGTQPWNSSAPAAPGRVLRQLLCRQHAEREAGEDQVRPQAVGGPYPTRGDGFEPDVPGVADTGIEVVERLAQVQVGDVDGVAGTSERVGERDDARRTSLRMVEQQHLCHVRPPSSARCRDHAAVGLTAPVPSSAPAAAPRMGGSAQSRPCG